MTTSILKGKRIELRMPEHDKDFPLFERWSYDTEFMRLWGAGPVSILTKDLQQFFLENGMQAGVVFNICLVDTGQVIGQVDLEEFNPQVGNAWLGIGIGERSFWNNGYGSEAMQILIRYGFEMLGLERISLNVFGFNQRAVRVYEKLGFKIEGRVREFGERDGQRWDLVYMGLLREEWNDNKVSELRGEV